ncbi:MAG: beta-lactamase family protein [Clostridiales bacterium]|nr:beta-lactamase family protein [Clostridiales bacterium]
MFFIPWSNIFDKLTPLSATIQEELDNNEAFEGIIVYISQDGEAFTYASGYHNRAKEIPAKTDALFKIASITKLYVAVATTKLIDEGILSLEDTLADLLPKFKDNIEHSDEITLKQLIMHRSGIPNYTDHNFDWAAPPYSNEACLSLVLDMPSDFKPDKKYAYSNTNYLLLGMIMNEALGYNYMDYIDSEILTPLKLDNTSHLLEDIDIDQLMSGYVKGYEPDIKQNNFRSPAGSMIATAEDVGVFIRALNDGSLLSDSEQDIFSNVYVYSHTGFLPGYQSIARYDKETDTVIILFGNTSEGSKWNEIEVLFNRIKRILKSEKK